MLISNISSNLTYTASHGNLSWPFLPKSMELWPSRSTKRSQYALSMGSYTIYIKLFIFKVQSTKLRFFKVGGISMAGKKCIRRRSKRDMRSADHLRMFPYSWSVGTPLACSPPGPLPLCHAIVARVVTCLAFRLEDGCYR